MFLEFVLSAIGYRASARALQIVAPLLPGGESLSANGGQFWLLRLGLYELERPKEPADDWVWMMDHTVQTGNGKCFLVVGVRLSAWDARREAALREAPDESFALAHQDLCVWSIELMESSTAKAVHERLECLSARTGITPCALLSDQGADVRRGAELFCQSPERSTVAVFDIAHAVANAVKRQLQNNSAWAGFIADANRCKKLIRQTSLAFLMPPDLKAKARWMNLDPLIDWSGRVLALLENPQPGLAQAAPDVSVETLERKLGWIREHAESIAGWARMLAAAAIILKHIRNHGYHRGACDELRPLLSDFTDGAAAALTEECLQFIRVQSEHAAGRRLLGSSEVLESLIGKGKQIQGRNKNGYTKSILAMAAAVTDRGAQTIQAAFSAVKARDVAHWIRSHLGLSLQSQRQQALTTPVPGTKTG